MILHVCYILFTISDIIVSFTHSSKTAHWHTELETVQLLECETLDFILPSLLLPNSLDLNPVNFCMLIHRNFSSVHRY